MSLVHPLSNESIYLQTLPNEHINVFSVDGILQYIWNSPPWYFCHYVWWRINDHEWWYYWVYFVRFFFIMTNICKICLYNIHLRIYVVSQGRTLLGAPVCVSICVCVLHFQSSQRNLYWGHPGARYWSAAQYTQLARCTQSTHTRLFSLASATNMHEGPDSCLFIYIQICVLKKFCWRQLT